MASLFAENIFFSAFIEFEKVITYYLHIIPDSCDISELRHFFFKQRVQLVRQIIPYKADFAIFRQKLILSHTDVSEFRRISEILMKQTLSMQN